MLHNGFVYSDREGGGGGGGGGKKGGPVVTGGPKEGCLVYQEEIETSRVFLRETTAVPEVAILLFGGALSVAGAVYSHHHHHVYIVYWYTKHPGPIVYSFTAPRVCKAPSPP